MTVHNIWHEILSSNSLGSIAPREQVPEIASLLVRSRIDPHLFAGNLVALVLQGRQTQADLEQAGAREVSKSARILCDPTLRPPGAPLWVLAAFPDVILWYNDRVRKGATSIASTVPGGQLTPNTWVSLVESFLTEYRNNTVEVSVPIDSATDIYAGSEILAVTGDENNFTMIARLTAGCYFRLKVIYGDRFPSEESLMAAAGILDASVYINQTRETNEKEILKLAQQTHNSETKLLDFISLFETLLLSIDNPNVLPEDVFRTVEAQKQTIAEAIERGKISAQNEESIVAGVEQFMNDRRNKRTWRLLGVKNR